MTTERERVLEEALREALNALGAQEELASLTMPGDMQENIREVRNLRRKTIDTVARILDGVPSKRGELTGEDGI